MLGGIFNLIFILLANNDDHYQTSYLDLQCLHTRHKKDRVKLVLNIIVRPANRDWACQTERCHTLSNI